MPMQIICLAYVSAHEFVLDLFWVNTVENCFLMPIADNTFGIRQCVDVGHVLG